jgi:hypothetical protein
VPQLPAQQPPAALVPGQTVVLPEAAHQGLLVTFGFTGPDADLTLLLIGENGLVAALDLPGWRLVQMLLSGTPAATG